MNSDSRRIESSTASAVTTASSANVTRRRDQVPQRVRGKERREQDRDGRRVERVGGRRIVARRLHLAQHEQPDGDRRCRSARESAAAANPARPSSAGRGPRRRPARCRRSPENSLTPTRLSQSKEGAGSAGGGGGGGGGNGGRGGIGARGGPADGGIAGAGRSGRGALAGGTAGAGAIPGGTDAGVCGVGDVAGAGDGTDGLASRPEPSRAMAPRAGRSTAERQVTALARPDVRAPPVAG